MKRLIIISPKFLKFLTGNLATGMALFPFIVVKNIEAKVNDRLINHEKIHLIQQLEMLILPFYIWYALEYTIRRFQFKNHLEAYKNISFEKEAYCNEDKLNYLKNRKLFSFLKFI